MPKILLSIPAQSSPQKTVGVKLRVIRVSCGLSQEALGDAIGLGPNTVSRMEAGESLDFLAVVRWVRRCGQSLDNFMAEENRVIL